MPSNAGSVESATHLADRVQPLSIHIEKPPQGTADNAVKAVSPQEVKSKAVSEKRPSRDLSAEENRQLMENLNQVLNLFDIEARILLDKKTHLKVIQLKDNLTQKLIRQVPSREFLSRALQTKDLIGLMIDQII